MEGLRNFLTESRQVEYRMSLNGCLDSDGLPISVTVLIDKEDQKSFEKWLEQEEGNTIGHASGGNIEY